MKNERLLLLLLAALNFTHVMDFMIMMPLSTHLIPLFSITPQQFSILVSSYTFSAGITSFISAFFVDRYDRKKILLFGYAGFLLGTLGCALAPTYSSLMTARIVAGIFGGILSGQVLSIVADLIPFERRASAMGIIMAAFGVASVVGVPFGLFLAAKFSWHVPFFVIAGTGFIIFLLCIAFIPSVASHLQEQKPAFSVVETLRRIIHSPNQMKALTFMSVMMFGHFLVIPFIAQYMEFNVGFTKHQITYIYFTGGLVSLFSAPLVGRMADRKGKHKVFQWSALLCIVPVLLITHMPVIAYYYVLIVTCFFFFVSTGRSIPAQAIVSQVVTPVQRGSFMSVSASLQMLAISLAAFVSGSIVSETADHQLLDYNFVGYLSAAFTLATVFLVMRVKTIE